MFLLVLGIILGLILSFFDKKRLIPEKGTKYIIRTILTTIAAMFGETGFLSENSSMTLVGISLVIFIMLISFIWVMFIQAEITKVLIFKNSNISANNLSNSELISFKGYAASQKFKELFPNVKIKEFEFKLKKNNDQTEPLIKEYMNNSDKYQGIIISYARAYPYFKKYPQLHKSYNFVNEPTGLIVNKNNPELLQYINISLTDLKNSMYIREKCKQNYGSDNSLPLCSLI